LAILTVSLNRGSKPLRCCGSRLGALVVCRAFFWLFAICPTVPAWAQAWQPARGEGSGTISYQNVHGGDHYDKFGKISNPGALRSSNIMVGFDYGITERIAVSAELPYVVSKFTLREGATPGPHQLHSTVDDSNYRGTLQDFHARIQYDAMKETVQLRPFFEAIIPTHAYETFGHSAPGMRLKEYRMGLNVGRWLDPLVPRAYFNLQPMYSFTESVADLNLDHVSVALEVGYDLDRFAIRALGGIEKRLGGVQLPVPASSPYFEIHDRIGREAFSYAGGGATFRWGRNTDLFAVFSKTLSAKNAHGYATLTTGVHWSFKTRRSRNTLRFPERPR